jgi:DNA-binding transcriptional ArsR family regulator
VNLADFFVLVHIMTYRITDLIAALVDIAEVPSVALLHAELEASRALAFSEPWTSAVLALLETEAHLSGQKRSADFLSERLGLDATTIERALSGLASAALIAERGEKYGVRRALTIDTRGHPEATVRLRRHWARVGAERLSSPGPRDLFAYNVFSISRADFDRIRELEQQYFREARAIIAASTPSEVAGLLTVQLFQWDDLSDHG